jgi:hypothetical protein
MTSEFESPLIPKNGKTLNVIAVTRISTENQDESLPPTFRTTAPRPSPGMKEKSHETNGDRAGVGRRYFRGTGYRARSRTNGPRKTGISFGI